MPSSPTGFRASAPPAAGSSLGAWRNALPAADSAHMGAPATSSAGIGERPPVAPRTLMDAFAQTLSCFRDRIAVDAPDAVLSYGELSREADALAARLRSAGIGPGDRVGVSIPSGTAELYVAILGVLQLGRRVCSGGCG